jgi:hypothetical protein
MIGPGGFAISSSHLFVVPILVLWVGLEKSKKLNFDVRNIFVGSYTEPRWGCSNFTSRNVENWNLARPIASTTTTLVWFSTRFAIFRKRLVLVGC